jgi:hypothetical protein
VQPACRKTLGHVVTDADAFAFAGRFSGDSR